MRSIWKNKPISLRAIYFKSSQAQALCLLDIIKYKNTIAFPAHKNCGKYNCSIQNSLHHKGAYDISENTRNVYF